ncbi:MAG: UbiA family prenyltransferase, partial [candidate division Zixibacteria bacterium]|nr:UbiA family prenyltransferase [candidate division Zixibacteria bacterium]
PALVGTTLPFWLKPPGFSFKAFEAIEFLIAILFFHTGISFLYAHFENKTATIRSKSQLLLIGIFCLLTAILIGLNINNNLELNKYVHKSIFIIYGFSAIFIGALYVVPFSFFRRMGGETILCVGLGMMPVLGAYIIQASDLTRTVYLASLPIVVSTGLWVWISELISRSDDENSGHKTMVMLFSVPFAGRFVTTILTVLIYLSLVLAVFGRSSLNPLSLTALLSIGFALKIISLSMKELSIIKNMLKARKYAFLIHLTLCIIIIVSSLLTEFTGL